MRRARQPRRPTAVTAAAAVCLACLACLASGCASAGATGPTPVALARVTLRRRAPPPLRVRVTVSSRASMVPVPPSYLGLSTEYWALPMWASRMPLLERALALVRVPGGGPTILRVGGDSSDRSIWDPSARKLPVWAFTLGPGWIAQARALVRRLGIRLLLDLNLITASPATAAAWARAAQAGLPRGSIVGFEVGNEPDIYSRADWRAIIAQRSPGARRRLRLRLPPRLTAGGYVTDFLADAHALRDVAPAVPLAGPELANPIAHRSWVTALLAGAAGSVGLVSIHRYPYTACPRLRGTPRYATIGRLLSEAATNGLATALAPTVAAARRAGVALRLTELNSVNCGGLAGVSDSFATALWAPGALFALLRAGVAGVNIHVRASAINAPFAITARGLTARPLLYGLILFARALGPEARLVRVQSRHPRAANVGAWAVRVGADTLHVVVIDRGRRSLRVSLRLPATGTAAVQRLLAPSARSRTGVTLAGRTLAADGGWQGLPVSQGVARRGGGYVVDVRRESAALVTVHVSPGALGAASATRH
ncbi:MAG: glycosyl hydrolase family 79 C-terminal domain-containing protein [Solirubrobacteraceae bacterium]